MQLPDSLKEFLGHWSEHESTTKQAFLELLEAMQPLPGLGYDFKARPGVSYSLRMVCPSAKRGLLALMDIIDDDPENRWLSVCFYADLIQDPEEQGDLIPGGLLGEDGYCFDLDAYDPKTVAYLQARLQEAYRALSPR